MVSDPQGRITSGIAPHTTVVKTLQFVNQQLPNWRDDPDRSPETAEEPLNGQLCKFLNLAARREDFPMAYFHHEERQTGRRRVDLSALPLNATVIEGRNYSTYTPFLVLEGKRLPAPTTGRQREYVIGDKESGGIQRFKLGLHGSELNHAGMIGYVQANSFDHWFASINTWIDDLSTASPDWTKQDSLLDLIKNSVSGTASCNSCHLRTNSKTDQIAMTHLWVEMR